jgi:hypothetical protein
MAGGNEGPAMNLQKELRHKSGFAEMTRSPCTKSGMEASFQPPVSEGHFWRRVS